MTPCQSCDPGPCFYGKYFEKCSVLGSNRVRVEIRPRMFSRKLCSCHITSSFPVTLYLNGRPFTVSVSRPPQSYVVPSTHLWYSTPLASSSAYIRLTTAITFVHCTMYRWYLNSPVTQHHRPLNDNPHTTSIMGNNKTAQSDRSKRRTVATEGPEARLRLFEFRIGLGDSL